MGEQLVTPQPGLINDVNLRHNDAGPQTLTNARSAQTTTAIANSGL